MVRIILLVVIYIAFISLGLPDSILGVAWPTMRTSLNLPLEAAGIFIMTTTICTAISSFLSGHILNRFGTGKVTFVSCVATGTAIFGYSFAPSSIWLMLLSIPLGLGAGAVDTGLNNYVAKNYSSSHMNWLHCFWGIGAFIGPNLMTLIIVKENSWRAGYKLIGIIQLILSLLLLISLPLWEKKITESQEIKEKSVNNNNLLRKKGVLLSIMAFPIYGAIEGGIGAWLGSYLIEGIKISQATAGVWVSLYFGSITLGRFFSGFIVSRFNNRQMIKGGLIIALVGALLLSSSIEVLILPAILLLGFGCAPVFPAMVHETPARFGEKDSEKITGYQFGTSYLFGTLGVQTIGILASKISLVAIPISISVLCLMIIFCTEKLNKLT